MEGGIKAVCELTKGADLTAGELIAFVGERIARYKKPQYVEFVATLPLKPDGAVDREKERQPTAASRAEASPPVQESGSRVLIG